MRLQLFLLVVMGLVCVSVQGEDAGVDVEGEAVDAMREPHCFWTPCTRFGGPRCKGGYTEVSSAKCHGENGCYIFNCKKKYCCRI